MNRLMRMAVLGLLTMIGLSLSAVGVLAGGKFVGELELLPAGCEAQGSCRLGQAFGFIQDNGLGWMADQGLVTDGASIPPWAQRFVGKPYDRAFIKAAVIHDHYCDRHVRTWRQTHRVFYDGLRASGVSPGKAGIMYFAVMVGGPKWIELIKGKDCPVGMACINQVDVSAVMPGGSLVTDNKVRLFLKREDRYRSAEFAETMKQFVPRLELLGDQLTPEGVEQEAAMAMNRDFFYLNGDAVGTGLALQLVIGPKP